MNELNNEQQVIVDCLNSNILLMAPAGTGKTNSISARINNILSKGMCDSSEILCLTFTNKAAKDMEERIRGSEHSKGVVVRTIHGFALDIVKEQSEFTNRVSSGFSVIDEEDVKDMLYDIFKEVYKKELSGYYLGKVALMLEMLSKVDIYSDDEEYKADSLFNKRDYEIKNSICVDDKYRYYHNFYLFMKDLLGSVSKEYIRRKTLANVVDFADLIVLAYRVLENKKVLAYYMDRFKFIHVDEVQDVSSFEYDLMEKMFSGNKVLMCGDVCQTIYEWRGSAPKIILEKFKTKYNPKLIYFVTNYRSTKHIFNGAKGFLQNALHKENLSEDYRESQTILEDGEKIKLMEFDNPHSEARWILDEMKAIGIDDWSKVAILCRGNKQNNIISKEIGELIVKDKYYRDNRIDFFLADEFRLFRKKEIKIPINFLKLVRNDLDAQAMKYILKSINFGVRKKVLDFFDEGSTRELGLSITDFLSKEAMDKGDYFSILDEALYEGTLVVFDVESTGVDVFSDDIIQIAGIKIDKVGKEIERFERFLRPRKSVGASVDVHGFSDLFLASEGEDAKVVLNEFLDFVKGCVVVGHNLFFDLSILRVNLHRYNLPKFDIKFWYDTLDIARRVIKLESYKLSDLVQHFDLKSKPDHNAMNDILATGELLLRLKADFLDPKIMERKAVYNTYIREFEFFRVAYDKVLLCEGRICELIKLIYEVCNLREIFSKDEGRVSNLESFEIVADNLDNKDYDVSSAIGRLIEYTALSNSQMDILAVKEDKIPIITVHQSKGLEYDYIFLASVNEMVFPSYINVKSKNLIEEMKLFYVAMTRAKKKLFISSSGKASSFIKMIPSENIENGNYY